MTHLGTQELWRRAMDELLATLEEDNPPDPKTIPTDAAGLWRRNGRLWIRYVRVLRQLEEVHFAMAQPQKRLSVRTTLEAVAGRVLELREALCQLRTTHYPPMDEFVQEFRITPDAIEVPVPRFAAEQTRDAAKRRDAKIREVLEAEGLAETEAQQQQQQQAAAELLDGSVEACQALLRQAQMRSKPQAASPASADANCCSQREHGEETAPSISEKEAAVRIQKMFRGHSVRKKIADARAKEAAFLGMQQRSRMGDDDERNVVARAQEAAARMKLVQAQHEEEYRRAIAKERQDMLDRDGPEMREAMRDEITHFFLASKEQLGRFPVFPTPENGGSRSLFPSQKSSAAPTVDASPPQSSQQKPSPARGKGPQQGGGKGKGKAPEPVPVLPPSHFLNDVHKWAQEYTRVWSTRDESKNPSQRHDIELLHEELRPEVEAEVRASLDAALQIELESLRKQVERQDRSKKRKKKKKTVTRGPGGADDGPTVYTIVAAEGNGQQQQQQQQQPKKKRRAKKPVDPTQATPIETLFAELVKAKVLVRTPDGSLADFVTTFDFMTAATTAPAPAPVVTVPTTKAKAPAKPPPKGKPAAATTTTTQPLSSTDEAPLPACPSAWDVKQAIVQLCILPLSSEAVHAHAPVVPSVLLFGPRGVGKRSMVRSIAADTGATFFDISSVDSKIFSGDVRLFVAALFRVACELQPSIIFASDVEKCLFGRQRKPAAPKTAEAEATAAGAESGTATEAAEAVPIDPAKLRRELARLLKTLKPTDRVLFLATSSTPQEAAKLITGFFSRFLFLGYPDYTARMALWSYFIQREGGVVAPPLSLSTMARVSEGYSAGAIKQAVANAIAANQRLSRDKKPLPAEEYINHLSKITPTFKADDQVLRQFASKLPAPELKTEIPDGQAQSKKATAAGTAATKSGRK